MKKLILLLINLSFLNSILIGQYQVNPSSPMSKVVCATYFNFQTYGSANPSNSSNHTFTWSLGNSGDGIINSTSSGSSGSSASLTIILLTCKEVRVICKHTYKITTSTTSSGGTVTTTVTDKSETAEYKFHYVRNSSPKLTLTVSNTNIPCGTQQTITCSVSGHCEIPNEVTYQWGIPNGWTIMSGLNTKSITVVTDKFNAGNIGIIVSTFGCQNSNESKSITRSVPSNLTVTNANLESNQVASTSIILNNVTNNSNSTFSFKSSGFIEINKDSKISNTGNNYTIFQIGSISNCYKIASNLKPENKDSISIDSNNKSVKPNTALQVQLYPNPAKENLTLKLNNLSSKKISIQVFDLMGRLVNEESVNDIIEANLDLPINISSLNSGNYILNLKTDNEQKQLRFIKE